MSAEFNYDLICVGSGPAGQRAAVQAAKLGKRVAVVEKQKAIGGVCLQTGTIPSKTFREAVRRLCRELGCDAGLGFAPKRKPSMEQLMRRVDNVIHREEDVQIDQMHRNDINVILGTASFDSPNSVLVETAEGSRSLTSRYFLVATGSRPADPRGVESDGRTVVTSDAIVKMPQLPRTMAVVGAGVIGTEYATMFSTLGVEVTVVDMRDRLMPFLDHEISDELMYQMRQKEVTFRMGEAVKCISILDEPRRQGMIELESGKRIVADVVLYCVGRQACSDGLNLGVFDIEPDKRGKISVDENYQTSAANVYAAGDVIGFPALAATSAEQGRRAACHMFGANSETLTANFPIGIYAIPEISMVGKTEEQLTEEKVPYEVGVARYREIARGQILGDDSGVLKMIFHRETGQLLSVHAIGTGVTELIHVGQAVMTLGGGIEYFTENVFNYPTLAECYKVAALNAANKLKRVRRIAPAA
ncbi:MAG: Si-specific NAD(P)(+) transhydrogenase [Phycisphaerae bacterium]|nr:Si-specific NAD(P)(+) transhydrogenase [Phycisphaerae bacterium]